MGIYNRRRFLKDSVMLLATVACSRLFVPSASCSTASDAAQLRSLEQTEPDVPLIRQQVQPGQATERGFNHPFFAQARHPDVIAHRGGDGERPGETMMAM